MLDNKVSRDGSNDLKYIDFGDSFEDFIFEEPVCYLVKGVNPRKARKTFVATRKGIILEAEDIISQMKPESFRPLDILKGYDIYSIELMDSKEVLTHFIEANTKYRFNSSPKLKEYVYKEAVDKQGKHTVSGDSVCSMASLLNKLTARFMTYADPEKEKVEEPIINFEGVQDFITNLTNLGIKFAFTIVTKDNLDIPIVLSDSGCYKFGVATGEKGDVAVSKRIMLGEIDPSSVKYMLFGTLEATELTIVDIMSGRGYTNRVNVWDMESNSAIDVLKTLLPKDYSGCYQKGVSFYNRVYQHKHTVETTKGRLGVDMSKCSSCKSYRNVEPIFTKEKPPKMKSIIEQFMEDLNSIDGVSCIVLDDTMLLSELEKLRKR